MSAKTPDVTPEEAEAQVRAAIAEANLRDDQLTAFVDRLPRMRASDLFSYLADPKALANTLDVVKGGADLEYIQLVLFAAAIAIKDEIDRRFPVPGGSP